MIITAIQANAQTIILSFVVTFKQMSGKLEGGKCKGFGCTWDSLRNSAGEKIQQLRSHPLGLPNTNFCSLLQELSEEQRFDVSYLDIGTQHNDLDYVYSITHFKCYLNVL